MLMKFRLGKKRQNNALSLSELFPEIVREYQLEQPFTVELLSGAWNDIAGDIIATHSMPDRLFRRTLFIAVDHPVYSNELMLMKDSIIKKIANTFGEGLIDSIKTEVKRLNWQRNNS